MKTYIGSGKQHAKIDGIVSVTIDIEKAKPFVYEYKGKVYLTFDVAIKREPDHYGKTHSVSVWSPDGKQSGNQQQKNIQPSGTFNDDDIPF